MGKWPTQMSKGPRSDHARLQAQAQAAQADRPDDRGTVDPAAATGNVVELRWPARARTHSWGQVCETTMGSSGCTTPPDRITFSPSSTGQSR